MSKYKNQPINSNNICRCGRHSSLGNVNPHERAQIYNWFRERYRKGYEPAYRNYLESYEQAHGRLAKDDFLPKVKEAYLARMQNIKQPDNQDFIAIQHWAETEEAY